MKTAEDILKSEMDGYYSKSVRLDVPTVEKLMQEYARQIAVAVRDECINRALYGQSISQTDIDQFIK